MHNAHRPCFVALRGFSAIFAKPSFASAMAHSMDVAAQFVLAGTQSGYLPEPLAGP